MIGLLAAFCFAAGPALQDPGQGQKRGAQSLVRPGDAIPAFVFEWNVDPLDPMRKSPKKFGVDNNIPWEFPWVMFGYARTGSRKAGEAPPQPPPRARFRVYSQERKPDEDRAMPVCRMLLTMWDEARVRMGYDHSEQYDGQIVDVFLCWGGKPGGEQRFDMTEEGGHSKAVNTIYVYDIDSFTVPMEMAREVAHEYGHAVLPAIGGYTEPENWANGYLGEKVFLRWALEGMRAGRLTPADTMGATADDIARWLAVNADPLVDKAAVTLPSRTYLNDLTASGMKKYIGLALYADTILPDVVFGRSMRLTGSTDAVDYPAAIVLAAEEPDQYDMRIPKSLANRPIWVPIGTGKLSGARILGRHGDWAQITAAEGPVHVVNR